MIDNGLIIQPNRVFHQPFDIIVGQIVAGPRIIPPHQRVNLFLSDGRVKTIVLETEMTSSPEAATSNIHAFRYSGDPIEATDLDAASILTNLAYDEAMAIVSADRQARLGGAVTSQV